MHLLPIRGPSIDSISQMIHELFLLLSGHASPILTPEGLPQSFPLVSPSERLVSSNSLQTPYHPPTNTLPGPS